jgi:hypothetical protein
MVLEVKGEVKASTDGRTRPLRTLQALPRGTKVMVASGSFLRLTYLQSGLRETVTGPLIFITGSTASAVVEGRGKLASERSDGSTTLVPKSENLRRMGGAKHARQDLDAGGLMFAYIPTNTGEHQVRIDPKPRIQDFSPSLRQLPTDRELTWIGGTEPYHVKLLREDGKVEVNLSDTGSALPLPELEGGYAYKLLVADSQGKEADPMEFYILSKAEAEDVRRDLLAIAKRHGNNRLAELSEGIAYLQARGLLEEALPLAKEAVSLSPEDVGLLTELGRLQINLGRLVDAEETLKRAQQQEAKRP